MKMNLKWNGFDHHRCYSHYYHHRHHHAGVIYAVTRAGKSYREEKESGAELKWMTNARLVLHEREKDTVTGIVTAWSKNIVTWKI